MLTNEVTQLLSSSASTKTSLDAIRRGDAGLNERRIQLLNRVPNPNDWAALGKNCVSVKDIAYLSAATQDEFALLRGKTKDIIFHGKGAHCNFNEELLELLRTKKLRLVAHTHSDYGDIEPSSDDREFLQYINQTESLIISYITGIISSFSANPFDDI